MSAGIRSAITPPPLTSLTIATHQGEYMDKMKYVVKGMQRYEKFKCYTCGEDDELHNLYVKSIPTGFEDHNWESDKPRPIHMFFTVHRTKECSLAIESKIKLLLS